MEVLKLLYIKIHKDIFKKVLNNFKNSLTKKYIIKGN